MSMFYELYKTEQDGPFEIQYRVYQEDMDPNMVFDGDEDELKEIYDKINRGVLYWFRLHVVALLDGVKLGIDEIGGCLYEKIQDAITDMGDDMKEQAISEAKEQVNRINKLLNTNKEN